MSQNGQGISLLSLLFGWFLQKNFLLWIFFSRAGFSLRTRRCFLHFYQANFSIKLINFPFVLGNQLSFSDSTDFADGVQSLPSSAFCGAGWIVCQHLLTFSFDFPAVTIFSQTKCCCSPFWIHSIPSPWWVVVLEMGWLEISLLKFPLQECVNRSSIAFYFIYCLHHAF